MSQLNICEKCGHVETCKYHNKPENKNKIVRDCRKFQISDEVLAEIDAIEGNDKYAKVSAYIKEQKINSSTRGFITR